MARSLLVVSEGPGQGKSLVAAGLAQRLQNAGYDVLLVRLGDASDAAAAQDATFFGSLPFGAGDTPLGLTQAASIVGDGDTAVVVAERTGLDGVKEAADKLDAAIIFAGSPGSDVEAALGPRYKGSISVGGEEADALAVIPHDQTLMAPTVRDVLAALLGSTKVQFLVSGDAICEQVLIAPISHDTGRMYFNDDLEAAVVCRDDKPELALSALAGHTSLLIITGGDQPLGYVAERAAAAGIPMAITSEGTLPTVQRIEETFGPRPLSHPRQVKRAAEFLASVELEKLLV